MCSNVIFLSINIFIIKCLSSHFSHCPDYDLCEQCEAIEGVHDPGHVFLKLKRPAAGVGRKPDGTLEPLLTFPVYVEDMAIPQSYR